MGLRGPVLATTDLSEAAEPALEQGRALASAIGAKLIVCHVLHEAFRIRMLFPQDAGIDATIQTEVEDKARQALGARLEQLFGAAASEIDVEIESGSPHTGILEIADRVRPGLIVVGEGSTALRVARSAKCPVLVAREGSPEGGSILVATDFSDPALPAVNMATAEAKRRGLKLRMIHCLNVGIDTTSAAVGALPVMGLPPSVVEQLEAQAQTKLAAALETAGVKGETILSPMPPAIGIIDAAEREPTSLVVVGSHGRGGISRLAMGSVAETVVNRAPCSVLVVPL